MNLKDFVIPDSTSSGIGNSYYTHVCGRQAKLDLEKSREPSFNMQVGSAIHKLLELYYTDTLKDYSLPLDDFADYKTDPIQEGLRLFAGYCTFFPQDEWTVISAERRLPRVLSSLYNKNGVVEPYEYVHKEDEVKLERLFGVPMAVRPDMKVYVNEEQAAAMAERRRINIVPGFYLIDHKSHDSRSNNAVMKYRLSTQFQAYCMAENAVFPDEPVEGMIINDLVRHQDLSKVEADGLPRSFQTFFTPAPTEAQQQALKQYYQWKKELFAQNKPELSACVDWISGKVCQHFTDGSCQRI